MVDLSGLRAPLTRATTGDWSPYTPPTCELSRSMMAPADAPVSASHVQLTARRRKSAWGPCSSHTRCLQRAIWWAPGGWVASWKGRCEPQGWPLRVISGSADTHSLSCVRRCAEAGTRRLPRATRAPRLCVRWHVLRHGPNRHTCVHTVSRVHHGVRDSSWALWAPHTDVFGRGIGAQTRSYRLKITIPPLTHAAPHATSKL